MSIIREPAPTDHICKTIRTWMFIVEDGKDEPFFGWPIDRDRDIKDRLAWYVERYTDETCKFWDAKGNPVSRDDVIEIKNLNIKQGTLFTVEWEGIKCHVQLICIERLRVTDAVKKATHQHWIKQFRECWKPWDQRFNPYPDYQESNWGLYLRVFWLGLLSGTVFAIALMHVGAGALMSVGKPDKPN